MSAYHEPAQELDAQTRDFVRALNTLKEEIEAIDWYQQRIVTCHDAELRAILTHNRNEEMEHAAMSLEWLRRNMSGWDERLRRYLFIEESIMQVEAEREAGGGGVAEVGEAAETEPTDLGIRGLKK